MADPTFTTPPTAPSRAEPNTFATRADAFVSWIVTFVTEMVSATTWFRDRTDEVSTDTASALASRNAAETAADEAEQSAISAAAVANFQGVYSGATAYTTGESVYYNGDYWIALQGSTGQTPAIGSDYWALAPGQPAERFLDTLPPSTLDLKFGEHTRIAKPGGIVEAVLTTFATHSRNGDVVNYFDATGKLRTSDPDEPVVYHDPDTSERWGLLMEPTETNELSDPFNPSQASWFKGNVGTPVQDQIGPDGVANSAWSIVENNDTAQIHNLADLTVPIVAGTTREYSFIVKRSVLGGRSLRLRIDGSPDAVGDSFNQIFDLDAKTASAASALGNLTIKQSGLDLLNDDWVKLYAVVAFGGAVTTSRVLLDLINGGTPLYDGDGASGFLFYGGQATEAGFPTSIISAGDGIRSASSLLIDGDDAADALNVNEGTLFWDVHMLHYPVDAGGGASLRLRVGGVDTNRIDLNLIPAGSSNVTALIRSVLSGVQEDGGSVSLGALDYGQRVRLALTYSKGGHLLGSVNGQTVAITQGDAWDQDVDSVFLVSAPQTCTRDIQIKRKALSQTELNLLTRNPS